MFMLWIISFVFSKEAVSPENRANFYLQKAYQESYQQHKKAKLLKREYENEKLQNSQEESSGFSYGVEHSAPNEAYPDFDSGSKTYESNPMEESYQDAENSRNLKKFEQKLQKSYVESYRRNAKQDGLDVHINEDYVVDDYKPQRPPASNEKPRFSGGN